MGNLKDRRDIELLYLREVAAWQVDNNLTHQNAQHVIASLPALQRGSVWRAAQVESLWDSIARGFPIGSLLLMPYQQQFGEQLMLLAPSKQPGGATHMLLDGQQRATSIALGFFTPWLLPTELAPAALWLDVGTADNNDRDFVFRLVTRAHPWGYPATGDRQRLESKEMRKAMWAFRDAQPNTKWISRRPPVASSWPWDAIAPLPVAAIIEAASREGGVDQLEQVLDQMLPHWQKIQTRNGWLKDRFAESMSGNGRKHIERFQKAIQRYCVPAQTVNFPLPIIEDVTQKAAHRPDPTETLFIRLNSGGTPLQGEDLIYSIIKAIWPNAAAMIDSIPHRFVTEARAALLIARLALVVNSDEGGESNLAEVVSIPAIPDVSRFRRLVHTDVEHPQFRSRMESYLKGKVAPLFEQARQLLTDSERGLPMVLAADLARGENGREVMFLLLRWIERLNSTGVTVEQLTVEQQRQAVGALCAISWFSRRADRCIAAIWPVLERCTAADLPKLFCRKTMGYCFLPVRGEAPLPCLPPPEILEAQISAQITQPRGGNKGSFRNPSSSFWREWEWYERFAMQLSGGVSKWYAKALPDISSKKEEEIEDASSRALSDWTFFADKLWGERRLVLYAQRIALRKWFPEFDPTDPDAMDEINRPWDIDHIHPSYFIEGRHNIPRIIRDWHGSIGNLRAWPLDANRSDAEAAPRQKLSDVSDEEASYGIQTDTEKRALSFISESQWSLWLNSTPDGFFPPRYLADPKASYGECRKALVKAITARTCALYREWHEQLRLKYLMPI